MIARAVAVASAIGLLLSSDRASARCEERARAWISACAAEQSIELTLSACPSGFAILEARAPGGSPLQVELARKAGGFVQVEGIAVSPVGQFADWAKEPAPTQRALEAVAACVRARPPTELLDGVAPVTTVARAPVPWLVIAAVVAAVAARARGCRRVVPLVATLASALLVFLVRRWLVPPQFVHQNGQAPLWIEFAVRGDSAPYGPGYAELFHPVVAHAARPDLRLIFVQELLASFAPAALFGIVRAAGARAVVAGIAAAAFALDPVITRMARSESYFATILTLLVFAAWVVASPTRRLGVRSLLAAIAAGCLVAAAARVHPLAWLACAMLPFVVLVAPGPLGRRARHACLVAFVTAAIVLVFAGPALRRVLSGDLGGRFLPSVVSSLVRAVPALAITLIVLSVLTAWRPSRPSARRALALGVVVAVALASNVVRIDTAFIASSYLHLFAPMIAASLAALTTLVPRRLAPMAFAIVVVPHVVSDRLVLIAPTDAMEQTWCWSWRETLPSDARVVWLERAGTRVLALPLTNLRVRPLPIHDHVVPLVPASGTTFYYRSSLCSTREGADACTEFERDHRMRLIERRTLPAVPSQPWNGYPTSEIDVALFVLE